MMAWLPTHYEVRSSGWSGGAGFTRTEVKVLPAIELPGAVVHLGSCLDVLPTMPDNSVDSIVTDPPYELGFMGKAWDSSGIAFNADVWRECLRVLKPGGHLLAFGGSRTWHRIAVAIEDAGFEVRDSIAWLYGSGFPKSLDVSKAIDKAAGAEREVIGHRTLSGTAAQTGHFTANLNGGTSAGLSVDVPVTTPATDEAKLWQGWGTALKPAFEPIVVARKPLIGTVAANVLEYGTGALNIDGTRIKRTDGDISSAGNRTATFGTQETQSGGGRWPSNVMLDEYTAELLDEQSGISKSPTGMITQGGKAGGGFEVGSSDGTRNTKFQGYGDSGGASRFFYVAKANKRDRNEGLDKLPFTKGGSLSGGQDKRNGTTNQPMRQNFHPTVKPTDLMRQLIRLVTPPGGTILDPFTGSGSTGKAAILEGFNFIGIELTAEYLPIIKGRLEHARQTKDAEIV